MFGYATDETEECMPLTVVLAHKLNQKIADLRRSGELWWARPDTKTQVSILITFVDWGAAKSKFGLTYSAPVSGLTSSRPTITFPFFIFPKGKNSSLFTSSRSEVVPL